MKHLLLVRHADYQGNKDGEGVLTELGCWQAEKLAQRLRGFGVRFDTFTSSSMPRAQQTAKIIAEILEQKYQADERIYEIENWQDYPKELKNSQAFLNDFQAGSFGQRVLVVAHGRRIRSFLDLTGVGLSEALIIPFGNTGLTLLEYLEESNQWQLSLLNDTSHLGSLKLWG